MTHKQDMDYFRLCKRTDPSYTIEVALKEYLSDHSEVAIEIARQYWEEEDDGKAMTNDEMWDYIAGCLTPEEAFSLGQNSERVGDSKYVGVDGYGNLVSLTSSEYRDWCRNACQETMSDIIEGVYEIPKELQEVIDLFADPDDGGYVANRKPVKKRTTKKTTRAGGERSSKTKKTPSTASKNRKPVSKKKSPAKTTGKKTGGRR